MSGVPEVECLGCGRRAACMQMRDGTVYKPFAWKYPSATQPLSGMCGDCQCRAEAAELIERVNACKTTEEYEAVKRSLGLGSAPPESEGQ